jgi:hypothetical protein
MQKLIDKPRLDVELDAHFKDKKDKPARPPELAAKMAGAAGDSPVRRRELVDLVSSCQDTQGLVIRHLAGNVEAALAGLEARLEVLEARRTLTWAGAHDIGRTYAPGDLVQRGGALWLALTAVTAGDGPGASPSWRRLAESKS